MADTQITGLDELLASELADRDVLPIVDVSAHETKKIKAGALVAVSINDLPNSSIDADKINWDGLSPEVINGASIEDRTLPARKIIENDITALEIAPNAVGASELADDSVDEDAVQSRAITADKIADSAIQSRHYSAGSIGANALDDNSVGERHLQSDSVGTDALKPGAVTSAELGSNSVGADALADNSVDTGALQEEAVTSDKLGPNSVGTTHLQSDSVSGAKLKANSVSNRELNINAVEAENISDAALEARHYSSGSIGNVPLADNSVNSRVLADNSVDNNAVQNGAISADKLSPNLDGDYVLADGSIDQALAENSVGSTELDNLSVGSEHLKNNSVTDAKLSGGIDGGRINNGSLSPLALPASAFSHGVVLDGTIQIDNTITAGTRNGIEYNSQGLIVGTTPLDRTDLPIATTSSLGAVSVPGSGGLAVTNAGALSINNSISPGTSGGITYNQHGLITAVGEVDPADLPIATNVTLGAVKVPTSKNNPILLDSEGNVTFRDGVTPGTFVNVTVDQYGLVTTGSDVLTSSQVPNLDASKITTGEFDTSRLADKAVTMPKLADYSISFIQEGQPSFTTALHVGCLWYQESTAQLRMYNGNSWMPVGFGRLSQENLRFGGTVDAATGLVDALTDAGRNAGLKPGEALPAATDALGGLYLVASVAGNQIAVLPGVSFDAGDWCLCINQDEGWIRINTLSGGGGGGGSSKLSELLDVDLNTPQDKDFLVYDSATSTWTNSGIVDGGEF